MSKKRKKFKSSTEGKERRGRLETYRTQERDYSLGPLSIDDDSDIDQARIEESLADVISRRGDVRAAARELVIENLKIRRRCRQAERILKEDVEELPEDAVVLTGEDAKTWNVVKELNKKGEEIKQAFTDLEKRVNEERTLSRQDLIQEAADSMEWNTDLLAKLIPDDATLIKEQVRQPGTKEVNDEFFITFKEGDKDKKQHILDYVEANHKSLLPALETLPENEEEESDAEEADAKQRRSRRAAASSSERSSAGTAWVAQRGDKGKEKPGKTSKADPVDALLKRRYPATDKSAANQQ